MRMAYFLTVATVSDINAAIEKFPGDLGVCSYAARLPESLVPLPLRPHYVLMLLRVVVVVVVVVVVDNDESPPPIYFCLFV